MTQPEQPNEPKPGEEPTAEWRRDDHEQPGYEQSYPPPGYPPGYPAMGYPPPRPTNGMAIASLVLGIVWIYWVGSILALIFGYQARKQIAERGEGGAGLATAGIVLGWVGVGVLGAVIVILIITGALY